METHRLGQKNLRAIEETGDGELIGLVREGKELEKIASKLKEGVKVKVEQELQQDWDRVDKSKYNEW